MEYSYTAYTRDRKLVKGKLSADSEQAAASVLDYGGYQVVNLKANGSSGLSLGKLNVQLSSPVKPKEILMFSRQLALLLESGTDLVNSLDLLQKQMTNRKFQSIVKEIINDIHNGASFSNSLARHDKIFPQMYIHAMAAGEQAGNLDIVLRQTADYTEREVLTRKKLKSALTYPIVVFFMAMIVVAVMSIFVFPTFVDLFGQFGAKLPLLTRIMIGMANWARSVSE